jgi:hypothetical protein
MNKLLIALAATFLAIPTLFGSPAEAGGRGGFRVFHNPAFHMIRAYHNDDQSRSYRKAKRRVKRKVHVAKKAAPKPANVAKIEPETTEPVSKVFEMENSSISTVDGAVAAVETGELETVAEVRDVGCKKFFPSAGMTLSVPCE